MFFCLGIEGSKDSLLRNGWFQYFSVLEFEVPMGLYLEMCGSNVFSVRELKVPKVPYLKMGGTNSFLFRN